MSALAWAIGLALLGAAVFVAIVWATQRSLLYFPSTRPAGPASAVLPGAEDVTLETEDGLRLGAFFVRGRAPRSGATILHCAGNAGDRLDRVGFAAAMAARGHDVLVFDYRGYGGNAGSPTEAGLAADARAAVRFLGSREGVDARRLVYYGESLGSAVCAALAAERRPAALVLRSPFTTLADVGRLHYPYLPVVDALLFDRYRTIDAVRAARVPLLVVAGSADVVVPAALSRALYDAAPDPKRLLVVEGAGHNDEALFDGDELVGAVDAFIREHAR